MPVAGRSAQRIVHPGQEPRGATLAVSFGERSAFFCRFRRGAWRIQCGCVSLQYVAADSADIVMAWAEEVCDIPSMVERRISERGVWN